MTDICILMYSVISFLAIDQDLEPERPSSVGSSVSAASTSRKRHHTGSDDFAMLRQEVAAQRKEDMAALGEIITKSNQTMLDGLSRIITQAIQTPSPQLAQPASYMQYPYPAFNAPPQTHAPHAPSPHAPSPHAPAPHAPAPHAPAPQTPQTPASLNPIPQASEGQVPTSRELFSNRFTGLYHVPDMCD